MQPLAVVEAFNKRKDVATRCVPASVSYGKHLMLTLLYCSRYVLPIMKKWSVHAVLFKEGDWWVGQWLEYDVAAQAKTVKDLTHELLRTLTGHILINVKNGRSEFANLKRAPDKFWAMYEEGIKIEPPKTAALSGPEELSSLEPELHLVA